MLMDYSVSISILHALERCLSAFSNSTCDVVVQRGALEQADEEHAGVLQRQYLVA